MKPVLFVSLLLLLPVGDHLEAGVGGHMGAARGFGGFGHAGGRALGSPVGGHFASGYGIHGFTRPWVKSGPGFHGSRFRYPGFGFGYYVPFYPYGGYFSSGDYGVFYLPPSEYYDDNDFQPYPFVPTTTQVNPKTDCKDSWVVERHASSLESAIRSAFQRQCENAHPANEGTLLNHKVD